MGYDELGLNCEPLVLDNGSSTLRFGFGGEDAPQVVECAALTPENICGYDAHVECLQKNHRILYPMRNGEVQDWNGLETLWRYVFSKLKVNAEERALLVSQSFMSPTSDRQTMCELLFEKFQVPALLFAMAPVLATYSCGVTTAFVVDVGHGATQLLGSLEGKIMLPNAVQTDFAGEALNDYWVQLLSSTNNRVNFSNTCSQWETARLIKEHTAYVGPGGASLKPHPQPPSPCYQLPDNNVIDVSKIQAEGMEPLFKPSLAGVDLPGIHELIHNSISSHPRDTARWCYNNIVLSGAVTLATGFPGRLEYELKQQQPVGYQFTHEIKVIAAPERKYSNWIGGSIMASLCATKWGQKSMYEEEGSDRLAYDLWGLLT
eukprot:TRINITY_DN65657_c3_g1_i1.p1 TRINITY_DN65657_c3_g1~~TRINITY_DN65657_c3_g1_i1.p1  ORF type:complete len:375 (+),score=16.35 TRINITY_DN65657_c3_g1_i1:50-1174(+)